MQRLVFFALSTLLLSACGTYDRTNWGSTGAVPNPSAKSQPPVKTDSTKPAFVCDLVTTLSGTEEKKESVPYPISGQSSSFKNEAGTVRIDILVTEQEEYMRIALLTRSGTLVQKLEEHHSADARSLKTDAFSSSFEGENGEHYVLECSAVQWFRAN